MDVHTITISFLDCSQLLTFFKTNNLNLTTSFTYNILNNTHPSVVNYISNTFPNIKIKIIHLTSNNHTRNLTDLFKEANLLTRCNILERIIIENTDTNIFLNLNLDLDISILSQCPNLRLIKITWHRITKYFNPSSLPKLKSIFLPNCVVNSDFKSILLMTLHHIHFPTNMIRLDKSSIYNIIKNNTKLKSLYFSYIPSTFDFSILNNHTKLTIFGFTDNHINYNIPALFTIPNLRTIYLSNCSNLHNINAITKLPNLKRLIITNCPNIDMTELYSIQNSQKINLQIS